MSNPNSNSIAIWNAQQIGHENALKKSQQNARSRKQNLQYLQHLQQQEEQSINFQCYKLYQVYQYARNLINCLNGEKYWGGKNMNEEVGQRRAKIVRRLKFVYEFVVRRLARPDMGDLKRFVGLLSLLSFLMAAARKQQHSLNFPNHVYRNIIKYSKNITAFWMDKTQLSNEQQRRKLLSTFLFTLSSFCQPQYREKGLKVQKIFSKTMIKSFLQLQLWDDQRVMRHYRIIIHHLYENSGKSLPNSLFLKSILYHFLACSSNKNTESTLIFLLNRFLRPKKPATSYRLFSPSLLALCCPFPSFSLCQKLLSLINLQGTSIQLARLSFSLFTKIIQIDNKICINFVTGNEFMMLVRKIYWQNYIQDENEGKGKDNYNFDNNIDQNQRIGLGLVKILEDMEGEHGLWLAKQLSSHKVKVIWLQILQCLSRKKTPSILLYFLGNGFLNHLHSHQQSKVCPSYHKYLLTKIIENFIILSSQFNQDICQALRNLFEFGQEFTYPRKEEEICLY